MLFWREPRGTSEMNRARQYVVYRFAEGEPIDLEYAENIVAITPNTFYKLPYEDGSRKYTYVVTALDRLQNESKKGEKRKYVFRIVRGRHENRLSERRTGEPDVRILSFPGFDGVRTR